MFISTQLFIFEHFANDEVESVRQSACLCLPVLSKRIEDQQQRRTYTAEMFSRLMELGDLVEYTLLENIGELIHIFHDDPQGPPDELLEVYYSQAPLSPASTEDQIAREFDNLDRAIVSAFNFPAVCLTLGAPRWPDLRPTYKALCNINHPRIIMSLAAAIHELAKILGPEITATDLLGSFWEYVNGTDDAREKVLESLPDFVSQLPLDDAVAVVDKFSSMWLSGSFPNWRHREVLAKHFAALLKHMASVGMPHPALEMLRHGLVDTFHAIREATIANVSFIITHVSFFSICDDLQGQIVFVVGQIPTCYETVEKDETSRNLILTGLSDLARSVNFKQRRT